MRLFVYEYTCASPTPLPQSWRVEGRAMLAALLEDFARLPDMTLATALAETAFVAPAACCRCVQPGNELTLFQEEARAADFTLVIAPESDGILLERRRWVDEAGGRWLGATAAAIELTADKLALAKVLHRAGVPTPRCAPTPATDWGDWPAVLKPRHGAGSQATFLLRGPADLEPALAAARTEGCNDELLLQSYVPGQAASVALLVGSRDCVPLLPAEQRLSADGRFHYLGGSLPLRPDLAERAVPLARQAVQAVPGLAGYVGVDLVLGEDGSADAVIEINPRLTTSYVGLRALVLDNLAEAMLRVFTGEPVVPLGWREGAITFEASASLPFERGE